VILLEEEEREKVIRKGYTNWAVTVFEFSFFLVLFNSEISIIYGVCFP